jgi:hypothetical protein
MGAQSNKRFNLMTEHKDITSVFTTLAFSPRNLYETWKTSRNYKTNVTIILFQKRLNPARFIMSPDHRFILLAHNIQKVHKPKIKYSKYKPIYCGNDSLSYRLLPNKIKVKIHKTVTLHAVLYGYQTWPLTLREAQRLRVCWGKHMGVSNKRVKWTV